MDGPPGLLRRAAAEGIGAFALTRHFPPPLDAALGALAYQLVRSERPR